VDYRLKPQGKELKAFAQKIRSLPPPSTQQAPIGLYIHDTYYSGQIHTWGKHNTEQQAIAYFHSYLLLKRAHLPFDITRKISNRHQLLIVPCLCDVQLPELKKLMEFVRQGGTLYVSIGDYNAGYIEEFGFKTRDFRIFLKNVSFTFKGVRFPAAEKNQKYPVLEKQGRILSAFRPDGSPAFLKSQVGKGKIFLLTNPLEREMNIPYFMEKNKMHVLYEFLAAEAGIKKEFDCNDPEVEMGSLEGDQIMLINHSDRPKKLFLKGTKEKSIQLPACGVATVSRKP